MSNYLKKQNDKISINWDNNYTQMKNIYFNIFLLINLYLILNY